MSTNIRRDSFTSEKEYQAILSIVKDLDNLIEQVNSLSAGVTDHGSLTGLTDDDHIQYTLRSILTTNGDLYTRSAGAISRLGIGSDGQVLTATSGTPVWATPSAGVTDHGLLSGLGDDDHAQYTLRSILSVDGDIYVRSGGVVTRLGVGANNTYLGVTGSAPVWRAQSTIDHGSLGGLADDDHPQYPQTGTAESINAVWTFQQNPIIENNSAGLLIIESDVSSGNRSWALAAGGEALALTMWNDNFTLGQNIMVFQRTLNVLDSIDYGNVTDEAVTIHNVYGVITLPDGAVGSQALRFRSGNAGIYKTGSSLGIGVNSTAIATFTTAHAEFISGSASLPGIAGGSDPDTGMLWLGSNILAYATGGVERCRITSGGVLEISGAGSAGTPIISRTNDQNTGIYWPAADEFAIVAGGNVRAVFGSGVDLLGSTSAPTWNASNDIFHEGNFETLGITFRDIPRRTSGFARGECLAISAGVTLNTSDMVANYTFSIYNDSVAAITITEGTGVTLRLAGTTSTGNRTLAARGFATVWCNSGTEAVIGGSGLT